jgi:hypothetical protein
MFAAPLPGTKELPFADILLSMTAIVTIELYKVDKESSLGFVDVQFDQYDLREWRAVISELTLPIQMARGKFKNLLPFLTIDKPVDLHVKLQLLWYSNASQESILGRLRQDHGIWPCLYSWRPTNEEDQ